MVYLYDACDQISDFCHQQLLRKMRRKIFWMDGQTDRGKTVYSPPPSGSGGIITYSFKNQKLITKYLQFHCQEQKWGLVGVVILWFRKLKRQRIKILLYTVIISYCSYYMNSVSGDSFWILDEQKRQKFICISLLHSKCNDSGLTKPGEVGDFFALVSMKSPNFCQKAKF
jgi:hypothetical protein